MDGAVEHEICGNCKKEIPQHNYVMHTAHCARNITLCQMCKEPFPKAQFEAHRQSCVPPSPPVPKKPVDPPSQLEQSSYFQARKAVEDKKVEARNQRRLAKLEQFTDTGYSLKSYQGNVNKTTIARATVDTGYHSPLQTDFARVTVNSYQGNASPQGGIVARATTVNNATPQSVAKTTLNSYQGNATPQSVTNSPIGQLARTDEVYHPTTPIQPIKKKDGLLPCRYCELEVPKLDLDDHENYCGSRTEKCGDCGEFVMFKYRQVHMDSNHGFLKLKDEPGPRPSWEPATPTTRPRPLYDSTLYAFPENYRPPKPKIEKGESYKEISRRLDCKTEYIRNLLHDSASITVPLRHNGAVPRNHFNHNKGPAPQPPSSIRRRNPPTELTVPCEFCDTPIPHEELILHETGCRPDLARYTPRNRRADYVEEDDYYYVPGGAGANSPSLNFSRQNSGYGQGDTGAGAGAPASPEVQLPCEFCAEMIPSSQLLRHQATCA